MKTIVTHISVDLDAVTSTWLIKRYLPGWQDAEIKHVSAGKTLEDKDPDADADIIHTDTGMGKFDHHQLNDPKKEFSATKRVFDFLKDEGHLKQNDAQALSRIADFVTLIDHFGEVNFPNPTDDKYDFLLPQIIDGMKIHRYSDSEIIDAVYKSLDGIFLIIRQKIAAEEEIKKGYIFESKWGKAIAMETNNEEAMKIALKMGYRVVIKKSGDRGFVRIKTMPTTEIDLTPVYEKVKEKDPKAYWFLHASKNMLLNGSNKRPDIVPSNLTLPQVIEIIRSIN